LPPPPPPPPPPVRPHLNSTPRGEAAGRPRPNAKTLAPHPPTNLQAPEAAARSSTVATDARGPLADLDDAPLARRGCSAMDEPEKVRGREDAASGHEAGSAEEARDGFQLVIHGKKKKRAASGQDCGTAGSGFGAPVPGAKAKVPFHDPSIPRP
jgi:hypothetical protein